MPIKKNYDIYLSSPQTTGNELKYLKQALVDNELGPWGESLNRFEKSIVEYAGVKHVLAVNSGTSAIHLALKVLGVEEGDEVICQAFTFVGTINPIIYQNAIPVFVDSEPETWNMDPQLLEEAIKNRLKNGKKPKAIIPVHIYGMPAKMQEIGEIAQYYEIPVIEDAAEALESSINGKKCGSFGDIGILSFNGNKVITASGGGALVSNDKEYIEKALFYATQAREETSHYEHKEMGYNYRLNNINACIGRGQMEALHQNIEKRRAHYKHYQQELGDRFEFLKEPPYFYSNRWLTTLISNSFEMKEQIRVTLEREQIESKPLWKPMHLQSL